jgi:hypothetical protein
MQRRPASAAPGVASAARKLGPRRSKCRRGSRQRGAVRAYGFRSFRASGAGDLNRESDRQRWDLRRFRGLGYAHAALNGAQPLWDVTAFCPGATATLCRSSTPRTRPAAHARSAVTSRDGPSLLRRCSVCSAAIATVATRLLPPPVAEVQSVRLPAGEPGPTKSGPVCGGSDRHADIEPFRKAESSRS